MGARVAEALALPFIDLDDVLLRLAEEETGEPFASCREAYKSLGKEAFRRLEALAAGELASKDIPEICALGGGTVENPEARRALEGTGFFVYLRESPDILYRRISSRGIPAFLDPQNPEDAFYRLFEKREKDYSALATITLDCRGRAAAPVAEEVLTRLKEAGYGG